MTGGEMAFLGFAVAAFALFGIVLAMVSHKTR